MDHVAGGTGSTSGSFGSVGTEDLPSGLYIAPGFCFIPSASSAALVEPHSRNYGYNIQANGSINNPDSRFKNIAGPAYTYEPETHNEPHASISIGGAHFLADILANEDPGISDSFTELNATNAFNYGTNTNFNPRNNIFHSVVVKDGGYLGINADKPIGYLHQNNGEGQEAFESVIVENGCGSTNVEVKISDDGNLIVGNPNGAIGKLTFLNGKLRLEGGAKIFIHDNSSIELHNNAQLSLEGDVEIHLLGDSAKLIIHKYVYLPNPIQNGNLKIFGTGVMEVHRDLRFNNCNLEINAHVKVSEGKHFETLSDMEVNLGEQGELQLLSEIRIHNGATLDINGEGALITTTSLAENNVVGSEQARFKLNGITLNGSLIVDSEPGLSSNVDLLQLIDVTVNGDIQTDVARTDINHCSISGELRIASFNDKNNFYPAMCKVNNCTFNGRGIVTGSYMTRFVGDLNSELPVEISNCQFQANASIQSDFGQWIKVSRSDFLDNSYIFLNQSVKSEIRNNYFDGIIQYSFTPKVHILGGWDHIVAENSFANVDIALNLDDNAAAFLSCNTMANNDYGLVVSNLAIPIINGAEHGNNTIVDNVTSNVFFNKGRKIDFTAGKNMLYNNRPNTNVKPTFPPEQHFFLGSILSGVMVGANACPQPLVNTTGGFGIDLSDVNGNVPDKADLDPVYEVTGNQWSSSSTIMSPQLMEASQFHLFVADIRDEIECKGCKTKVVDILPVPFIGCSGLEDDANPIGGAGAVSNPIVKSLCSSCPLLFSPNMKGMRLNEAVLYATSLSSVQGGTNDPLALNLLREILTQEYIVKTREVYDFLETAWLYTKITAAKISESGNVSYAKTLTDDIIAHFHPQDYFKTTTLEQLNYVFDIAELNRRYGSLNAAMAKLYELVDEYDDFNYLIAQKIDQYTLEMEVKAGLISEQEFELRYSVGGGGLGNEPEEGGYKPCFTFAENPYSNEMKAQNNGGLNEIFSAQSFSNWGSTSSKSEKKNAIVDIYPNPAELQFSVVFTTPISQIKLSDVSGRVVKNLQTQGSMKIFVDVRELPQGSYLIESFSTQGQVVDRQKLILK